MKLNISNLEEERKQTILNSALKEFALRGYDDASTNIIAKDAGFSKGLLFHYVKSKEDLFLYLVDYCNENLNLEYINKMDFKERDIFKRIHNSYILQVDLLKKHPWIFDFVQLKKESKSDIINERLKNKNHLALQRCFENIFIHIDESKFRNGLDIENCKQLIFWGNVGFSNQLLDKIKNTEYQNINYQQMEKMIDKYFVDLKTVFYK